MSNSLNQRLVSGDNFFFSLVEPSSEIEAPEDRRRARILTTLISILIPMTFIVGIGIPVFNDWLAGSLGLREKLREPDTYAVFLSIILMGLIHPLSRRKHYTMAARGLIGILVAGLSFIALNDAEAMRTVFTYLLLTMLVASLFLSFWETMSVAVVNITVMLLIAIRIESTLINIIDSIAIFCGVGGLLLLVAKLRQQDMAQIEKEIEERKQAERKQALLIEELDAFARTVAHDLKNPLGIVLGYSTMLLMSDFSEEKQRHYEDRILYSAKKMDEIINSLLLLARLRTGEEVEIGKLNMTQIIADTLDRLESSIQEKEVQIILPESWPDVYGYRQWVEEIWANIISNAIKYGGEPPIITLSAKQVGQFVRFSVKDNGKGMTEIEQSSLFQEFSRLDQHKGKIEGHGLGLSIVRRIARTLDGEVGVESEVGLGSAFWFSLPITPTSKPEETA